MEILKAHPDEYDDLVSLYAKYNFALTKREYFDWKFFQNPVGEALIYKMVDKGQLVGAVAIIPQRFRYQDKEIIGLQTVDGLMGKEIRGKGLFNDVMAFLRQQRPDWLEGQEYFYLSFPSLASSVQAHAHAGWTMLGHFLMRTFVLRPGAVARRVGRPWLALPMGLPLVVTRVAATVMRGDGYAFSIADGPVDPPAGVEVMHGARDRVFVKWRVLDHPRDDLALVVVNDAGGPDVGFLVIKRIGRQFEIIDICLTRGANGSFRLFFPGSRTRTWQIVSICGRFDVGVSIAGRGWASSVVSAALCSSIPQMPRACRKTPSAGGSPISTVTGRFL